MTKSDSGSKLTASWSSMNPPPPSIAPPSPPDDEPDITDGRVSFEPRSWNASSQEGRS